MNSIKWKIRLWRISYWATAPFRVVSRLLSRILTVHRVAFLLAVVAAALWYLNGLTFQVLLPNIVTDLLGVGLTVFIIDAMYQVRSDRERKRILLSKLASKNNAVCTEAYSEMEARGWTMDGTLESVHLTGCNLDGNKLGGAAMRRVDLSFASLRNTTWFETDLRSAWLDNADLTGATLSMPVEGNHFAEVDLTGAHLMSANLTGANVRPEQLRRAASLWRATMPDGKIYDGRFNLKYDTELFLSHAPKPITPDGWAQFYGVSVSDYLSEQLAEQGANSSLKGQ